MRTMSIMTLAALILAGCGGGTPAEPADAPDAAAPEIEAAAPAAEEPAAASGALTKVGLEAFGEHAHGFQPWDEGFTALKAAYGDPMGEEEGTYYWFAKDGEDCWRLSIQNMGGTVGARELKRVEACP